MNFFSLFDFLLFLFAIIQESCKIIFNKLYIIDPIILLVKALLDSSAKSRQCVILSFESEINRFNILIKILYLWLLLSNLFFIFLQFHSSHFYFSWFDLKPFNDLCVFCLYLRRYAFFIFNILFKWSGNFFIFLTS